MDEVEKEIVLEDKLSKKIMKLISPLINGLTYSQIDGLLSNLRNRILDLTKGSFECE